jgi:hypothetical protein
VACSTGRLMTADGSSPSRGIEILADLPGVVVGR